MNFCLCWIMKVLGSALYDDILLLIFGILFVFTSHELIYLMIAFFKCISGSLYPLNSTLKSNNWCVLVTKVKQTFLENLGESSRKIRSLGSNVLKLALTYKQRDDSVKGPSEILVFVWVVTAGWTLTYWVKNNLHLQSDAPLHQPPQVRFPQRVGGLLSVADLRDGEGIRCWTRPWTWPSVAPDHISTSPQPADVLAPSSLSFRRRV